MSVEGSASPVRGLKQDALIVTPVLSVPLA